ncbi:MAG: hypothetical protein L6R41_003521 [Letrouitia leprolyta]|nr:MAG: hypothetical protein L6R41_003521 [Letrouitia leprolyta]
MRDHWRDEGHRREDSEFRGRHRERSSDRPKSSATLKKRERSVDVEVKIKGRATLEEAHNLSSPIIGKIFGSTPTIRKGHGAGPHAEQLLLVIESDREALICFIHTSTSTREPGIASIGFLGYRLPIVQTTILCPTTATEEISTVLLLVVLDIDHLSGEYTGEITAAKDDLQRQDRLAIEARTNLLRKRIFFLITNQEQEGTRLIPSVNLELYQGADKKSHPIEGDLCLDYVKDPSDRPKD